MDLTQLKNNLSNVGWKGIGGPLAMLMLLAMIIVPLPAFALDMFFTFNITLSMVVIIVVIYTMKPLEFAAFPTGVTPCCHMGMVRCRLRKGPFLPGVAVPQRQ